MLNMNWYRLIHNQRRVTIEFRFVKFYFTFSDENEFIIVSNSIEHNSPCALHPLIYLSGHFINQFRILYALVISLLWKVNFYLTTYFTQSVRLGYFNRYFHKTTVQYSSEESFGICANNFSVIGFIFRYCYYLNQICGKSSGYFM